jgi:hypothetical protein
VQLIAIAICLFCCLSRVGHLQGTMTRLSTSLRVTASAHPSIPVSSDMAVSRAPRGLLGSPHLVLYSDQVWFGQYGNLINYGNLTMSPIAEIGQSFRRSMQMQPRDHVLSFVMDSRRRRPRWT